MNFEKALTIYERISMYKKHGIVNYDYHELQNWINTRGTLTESDFKSMLETCAISSEDFNCGLKKLEDHEVAMLQSDIMEIDWVKTYKEIINDYKVNFDKVKLELIDNLDNELDFGLSLAPFILRIQNVLEDCISNLCNIKLSSNARKQVLEKCSSILIMLSIKNLVWSLHSEMNISTDTPADGKKEKFLFFVKDNFLYPDDLVKYYDKFPVIARRLTTKCCELAQHFTEFFKRIDDEFINICQLFELNKSNNEITRISCDEGDTHQQGRFVIKVCFGNEAIIYKPRNLKIEESFFEIIKYLNENSELIDMYINKAIYRDNYTFEKFVSYEECVSENEVKLYYQRFGQLSAMIYIFSGNDIHYENIIAHGEHPVIVDIETLFQQLTSLWNLPQSAFYTCYKECLDSIAGTSLIPIITFTKGNNHKGIDISALNGDEQLLPFKVLVLKDANTDKMRFEYGDVSIKSANNIPILAGTKVDFLNYIDEIISGFRNCILYIYNHKNAFLQEGGYLDKFKKVMVRQLLKSTQNYAKLMDFSSHPNYSSDMLRLERMFHNAWNCNYRDKRAVFYEINDMLFGDIPIFFSQVDSKDLVTSTGDIIPEYFVESGYDLVYKRIKDLTLSQINKQISQIAVSLGLFPEKIRSSYYVDSTLNKTKISSYDETLCLNYAENIAQYIISSMVIDQNSNTVNWNNVAWDDINACWKVRPLDQGLCYGLSGMYVFFSLLNKYSKNVQFDELPIKILTSIIDIPNVNYSFGVHTGIASAIYPLLLLSRDCVENKTFYLNEIYRLVKKIFGNLEKINKVDFIDGYAGLLKILVEIYKIDKSTFYLEKIRVLSTMIGEMCKDSCTDCGFGHGLAGVYYSLKKSNLILKDDKISILCDDLLSKVTSAIDKIQDISWENGLGGILISLEDTINSELIERILQKYV